MYVAVVVTKGQTISNRNDGSWSCFVGEDKEDTIKRALTAKQKWERDSGKAYSILGGELTDLITTPIQYEETSIRENIRRRKK